MTYRVDLAARAERDFAAIYQYIDAEQSQTAATWYRKMKQAVLSLEELPTRCSATPESSRLRHLLYGRKPHMYRIIFRVIEKEKRVEVLHIRHAARRSLRSAG